MTLPLDEELLDEDEAAPPAPPIPDDPDEELLDEVVMPPWPPLDVEVPELELVGASRLSS